MKLNPIKELRWLATLTLIGWALDIVPGDGKRAELAQLLLPWIRRQTRRAG